MLRSGHSYSPGGEFPSELVSDLVGSGHLKRVTEQFENEAPPTLSSVAGLSESSPGSGSCGVKVQSDVDAFLGLSVSVSSPRRSSGPDGCAVLVG